MLDGQVLWTCSKVLSHRTRNPAGGPDAARRQRESSPEVEEPPHSGFLASHPPPFTGATGSLATGPVLSRLHCVPRCKVRGVPAGPRVQAGQKCILDSFSTQRSPATPGSPIIPLVTLQHQCLLSPRPKEARRPRLLYVWALGKPGEDR